MHPVRDRASPRRAPGAKRSRKRRGHARESGGGKSSLALSTRRLTAEHQRRGRARKAEEAGDIVVVPHGGSVRCVLIRVTFDGGLFFLGGDEGVARAGFDAFGLRRRRPLGPKGVAGSGSAAHINPPARQSINQSPTPCPPDILTGTPRSAAIHSTTEGRQLSRRSPPVSFTSVPICQARRHAHAHTRALECVCERILAPCTSCHRPACVGGQGGPPSDHEKERKRGVSPPFLAFPGAPTDDRREQRGVGTTAGRRREQDTELLRPLSRNCVRR